MINMNLNFNRLSDVRTELRSIIQELQNIESGVRSGFTGIGQDMCANGVVEVINHYQRMLNRLDSMQPNFFMSLFSDD